MPVQVVVDVEVAGEPGAGEVRLVPGAVRRAGCRPGTRCPGARGRCRRRPAASSASSAHAVCDAVDAPRPPDRLRSSYERRSSPQPPSAFWWRSSQCTARRDARVAGAGTRRRPARARPRRCRRRGWRPSARTTSRRAPARPRSQAMAALAAGRGSASGLGGEHLDDVGGDVGARRVDDLAEVAERQRRHSRLVLSASNAAQPPSRHCMPSDPARRRARWRPAARPRPGLRPAAAPAPPRRCRRRRGSCRWRTRTPSRPAARSGGARPSRRRRGSPREQPPAGPHERRIVGRHAGVGQRRPPPGRCPTPATGTPPAGGRRRSWTVNRSRPARPAPHHRVVERVAEQVQGDQRVHPRRLDAAPASRRPPGGGRSTARRRPEGQPPQRSLGGASRRRS